MLPRRHRTPLISSLLLGVLATATPRWAGADEAPPGPPAPAPTRSSIRTWSLNDPTRYWAIRGYLEAGLIAPYSHIIQFGQDGSRFDYVHEGSQNVAFPTLRVSAELELGKHHNIILLYQPIDVRTEAVLRRDVRVDKIDFANGTPINLRYGFDFYRVSYLYDFYKDPRYELAVGASVQLRDASITFTSIDTQQRVVNTNLGVVPLIKVRGRYTFKNGFWLGLEADGIYAAGRIITGTVVNGFIGALYDISARAGFRPTGFLDIFFSLRFLGGGARGTERRPTPPSDGYTDNWIHTVAFTVGVGLR
ncbi:MAG TPA: hypothetical protein VH877_31470 [Polyangia bacterium]|jgi:hypothetical protein|nr:hypothetical protein [Polyangia bacterium]